MNREKARLKQEIDVSDHLSNMVKPKCKILDKDNNMNQTQYNQSYYNNNNNLRNNLPYYYYGYENNTSYPYSNINSQYNEEEQQEEKKLSIDDKIKIQKVLKNLENYLEKFYHRTFIFQILSWLRYQCFTQKAIRC